MNDKVSWSQLKTNIPVGSLIKGVVKSHETYGIYLDVDFGYDAIIPRTEFKDVGRIEEDEYPPLGSKIEAKVLGFRDHRQQIWLSIKPSVIDAD